MLPFDAKRPGPAILGEVYQLPDPGDALLAFDEYEGCGPRDPKPHRFERVSTDVRLDSGGKVRAWIYVLRDSVDGAERIESGDWVAPS